ncbi:hypothetical protein ACLBKU_16120 [Erythrobacter sp. NE805]|uniref:hypothetical protein n=1 Tax=Erythrobacter sp. NE805 TaxID=3389875 RepID=UPI00396B34F5
MLSAAITLLFTLAGIVALASIAHSLRAARTAWEELMREGEVLRAAAALQASAREMGLRPAAARSSGRVIAMPRPAVLAPLPRPLPLPLPLQACAA